MRAAVVDLNGRKVCWLAKVSLDGRATATVMLS